MSLLASFHYTFKFQFPQLTEPSLPSTHQILIKIYIHHDRTFGHVMEGGNVRQCRNIKILRTWKQLQSDIERSSYDHILVHCALCALNGLVCVMSGGGDNEIGSRNGINYVQIMWTPANYCLTGYYWALTLEWHCAALTWHWTLDFLFCITQCLNSWRPSKFQACANRINISITLFVRNALVAPAICDENQFRAAWYMEIMAYVYVREKLWRYELSDRGNMQDKYADCGLKAGGGGETHETWEMVTQADAGR